MPSGRYAFAMSLAYGGVVLAGATAAQNAVAPDPDPPASTVEEEITVVDRAADSQTTSTTILEREEIVRSTVRTTGELVQFVPGVHVVGSGSRGGTAHAQVRGGDPNFTLVLLDGIPLNDPTGVQGGALNLSTVPVRHLERAEVVRGSSTYYFGSSAVGGVLNLTSRRGGEENHGEVFVEAGDHSLAHGVVSVGGPAGRGDGAGDFFLGVDYEEEEGTIALDTFDQLSMQANVGFAVGDGADLRLVGRFTDWTIDDYPESSGGPVFGSGELRHSDGEQLSGGLNLSFVRGSSSHAGSIGVSRSDTGLTSPAIFPLVPPSIEDREYTRSQLSWVSRTQVSARLGFSAGAQIDNESASNQSVLILPPFLGGEVDGSYDLDRTTPSVFVEGSIEHRNLVVEVGTRVDDPEDLDDEWSPRLGLHYRLGNSDWQLRGGWSRAFKLPSFFALASPPQLGGNPDLLPETSEGMELGIEHRSARSQLAVVAFRIDYEDLIDFDFDTFSNVNRSTVEAEGIELFLYRRLSDKLEIALNGTFQDVQDPTSPGEILRRPDWFGSLRLDWRPIPPLRLRLDARLADDSADVQLPVPDRNRVEGYEVLGLGASFEISRSWAVTGRVDNLTDEDYEHFIGFPQPGRSARAGVEYRFP